ncbi:MAG TPA: 50S ribosomal protein L24e [Candidatus Nanoarchaeia archaeon]|nr:50S ribosomal protein L24e [Candidatus Nanoarchaeia archaeon]
MAKCSFCGNVLEKGTGKMLVKNDSSVLYFCSSKCENNSLKLNRNPREVKWTKDSRKARGKN